MQVIGKFVTGLGRPQGKLKINVNIAKQFLQTARLKHIKHEDAREIRVPLPYGAIAGMWTNRCE